MKNQSCRNSNIISGIDIFSFLFPVLNSPLLFLDIFSLITKKFLKKYILKVFIYFTLYFFLENPVSSLTYWRKILYYLFCILQCFDVYGYQ